MLRMTKELVKLPSPKTDHAVPVRCSFICAVLWWVFIFRVYLPRPRALDTARSPVAGCVCSAFIEMWSEEVKKSPVVVFRLGVFSGACPRAVCSLFTLKGFARREKPRLFDFVKGGKSTSLGITDNSMQNRTA